MSQMAPRMSATDFPYSLAIPTNSWKFCDTSPSIKLIMSSTHSRTLAILVLISPQMSEICLAVAEELEARFPISWATTANPLPCSPALAASMDAFRESRLVWLAISKICLAISLTRVRDCKFTMAASILLRFCRIFTPASCNAFPAMLFIFSAVWINCLLFSSPVFTLSAT